MAGFGTSAMGVAPFGVGTPAIPPPAPTGSAGSRFIDPLKRDYSVDAATGQFKQMPGTRQRVMLAVLTELESSGIRGFGIKPPTRMGTTFEAEMRGAVRTALRQMIEVEKCLRLDGVIVERGASGRASTTILYKDLITGESAGVRI